MPTFDRGDFRPYRAISPEEAEKMQKEDAEVVDNAAGNEWNPLRLFCHEDGCTAYIKGTYSSYAGSFQAETGQHADLRNQVWNCNLHDSEA